MGACRGSEAAVSDSDATRKRALVVAIGEARGDWMASHRREAFRAACGRDPDFTDPDDFAMACRFAGRTEVLYALFVYDIHDALADLTNGGAR